MSRLRIAVLAMALALWAGLAPPAMAIGLQAARAQGLVGETRSGFVAPVKPPSGAVRALVNKVNAQRRAQYKKIASRNGVGVEAVGRLTAQKVINGLPRGSYYQSSNGRWVRK